MTNIYDKINAVKEEILTANLKKSGKNSFAKYEYYELADFLPFIVKSCNTVGLFTMVSFDNEKATLKVINTENPEEVVEITSPMRELELKGCNQIQALGGIETYQRRYLYMALFDIVENDMFDGVSGKEEKSETKTLTDDQKKKGMELVKAFISKYGFNAEPFDKEKALEEGRELLKVPMEEKDKIALIALCKRIKG